MDDAASQQDPVSSIEFGDGRVIVSCAEKGATKIQLGAVYFQLIQDIHAAVSNESPVILFDNKTKTLCYSDINLDPSLLVNGRYSLEIEVGNPICPRIVGTAYERGDGGVLLKTHGRMNIRKNVESVLKFIRDPCGRIDESRKTETLRAEQRKEQDDKRFPTGNLRTGGSGTLPGKKLSPRPL